MTSLRLRQQFCDIARTNVGKKEVSRNQAPWIKPLWTATSYPEGHAERQPYCAAGMAWTLREWLKLPDVLAVLHLTAPEAERWRCKSASVYRSEGNNWLHWAKTKGLTLLKKDASFHTGDLILYSYSHIECYTGDLPNGRFTAIGYNTDDGGSRDGDGCFEKPRSRSQILSVIRIMP